MSIGPIAEGAIYRARTRALEQQLTDSRALADRRARDAYDDGLERGRASWPLALLLGAVGGSAATLIAFALFA